MSFTDPGPLPVTPTPTQPKKKPALKPVAQTATTAPVAMPQDKLPELKLPKRKSATEESRIFRAGPQQRFFDLGYLADNVLDLGKAFYQMPLGLVKMVPGVIKDTYKLSQDMPSAGAFTPGRASQIQEQYTKPQPSPFKTGKATEGPLGLPFQVNPEWMEKYPTVGSFVQGPLLTLSPKNLGQYLQEIEEGKPISQHLLMDAMNLSIVGAGAKMGMRPGLKKVGKVADEARIAATMADDAYIAADEAYQTMATLKEMGSDVSQFEGPITRILEEAQGTNAAAAAKAAEAYSKLSQRQKLYNTAARITQTADQLGILPFYPYVKAAEKAAALRMGGWAVGSKPRQYAWVGQEGANRYFEEAQKIFDEEVAKQQAAGWNLPIPVERLQEVEMLRRTGNIKRQAAMNRVFKKEVRASIRRATNARDVEARQLNSIITNPKFKEKYGNLTPIEQEAIIAAVNGRAQLIMALSQAMGLTVEQVATMGRYNDYPGRNLSSAGMALAEQFVRGTLDAAQYERMSAAVETLSKIMQDTAQRGLQGYGRKKPLEPEMFVPVPYPNLLREALVKAGRTDLVAIFDQQAANGIFDLDPGHVARINVLQFLVQAAPDIVALDPNIYPASMRENIAFFARVRRYLERNAAKTFGGEPGPTRPTERGPKPEGEPPTAGLVPGSKIGYSGVDDIIIRYGGQFGRNSIAYLNKLRAANRKLGEKIFALRIAIDEAERRALRISYELTSMKIAKDIRDGMTFRQAAGKYGIKPTEARAIYEADPVTKTAMEYEKALDEFNASTGKYTEEEILEFELALTEAREAAATREAQLMAEEAAALQRMDDLDNDSMALEAEFEAAGNNPEELIEAVDQDLIVKELLEEAAAEAPAEGVPTDLYKVGEDTLTRDQLNQELVSVTNELNDLDVQISEATRLKPTPTEQPQPALAPVEPAGMSVPDKINAVRAAIDDMVSRGQLGKKSLEKFDKALDTTVPTPDPKKAAKARVKELQSEATFNIATINGKRYIYNQYVVYLFDDVDWPEVKNFEDGRYNQSLDVNQREPANIKSILDKIKKDATKPLTPVQRYMIEGEPTFILQAEDGTLYHVDGSKFDSFNDPAYSFRGGGPNNPIAIYKDGKFSSVLMPIRSTQELRTPEQIFDAALDVFKRDKSAIVRTARIEPMQISYQPGYAPKPKPAAVPDSPELLSLKSKRDQALNRLTELQTAKPIEKPALKPITNPAEIAQTLDNYNLDSVGGDFRDIPEGFVVNTEQMSWRGQPGTKIEYNPKNEKAYGGTPRFSIKLPGVKNTVYIYHGYGGFESASKHRIGGEPSPFRGSARAGTMNIPENASLTIKADSTPAELFAQLDAIENAVNKLTAKNMLAATTDNVMKVSEGKANIIKLDDAAVAAIKTEYKRQINELRSWLQSRIDKGPVAKPTMPLSKLYEQSNISVGINPSSFDILAIGKPKKDGGLGLKHYKGELADDGTYVLMPNGSQAWKGIGARSSIEISPTASVGETISRIDSMINWIQNIRRTPSEQPIVADLITVRDYLSGLLSQNSKMFTSDIAVPELKYIPEDKLIPDESGLTINGRADESIIEALYDEWDRNAQSSGYERAWREYDPYGRAQANGFDPLTTPLYGAELYRLIKEVNEYDVDTVGALNAVEDFLRIDPVSYDAKILAEQRNAFNRMALPSIDSTRPEVSTLKAADQKAAQVAEAYTVGDVDAAVKSSNAGSTAEALEALTKYNKSLEKLRKLEAKYGAQEARIPSLEKRLEKIAADVQKRRERLAKMEEVRVKRQEAAVRLEARLTREIQPAAEGGVTPVSVSRAAGAPEVLSPVQAPVPMRTTETGALVPIPRGLRTFEDQASFAQGNVERLQNLPASMPLDIALSGQYPFQEMFGGEWVVMPDGQWVPNIGPAYLPTGYGQRMAGGLRTETLAEGFEGWRRNRSEHYRTGDRETIFNFPDLIKRTIQERYTSEMNFEFQMILAKYGKSAMDEGFLGQEVLQELYDASVRDAYNFPIEDVVRQYDTAIAEGIIEAPTVSGVGSYRPGVPNPEAAVKFMIDQLYGQRIIDAMKLRGYEAIDPYSAITAVMPSSAVGPDTLFVPTGFREAIAQYDRVLDPTTTAARLLRVSGAVTRAMKTTTLMFSLNWQLGDVFTNVLLAHMTGVPFDDMIKMMREVKAAEYGPGIRTMTDPTRTDVPQGDLAQFLREAPVQDISLAQEERAVYNQTIRKEQQKRSNFLTKTGEKIGWNPFKTNESINRITRHSYFLAKFKKALDEAGLDFDTMLADKTWRTDPKVRKLVDDIAQQANDILGDFMDMSYRERSYWLPNVPFYTWAKHIHKVMLLLAKEHPQSLRWYATIGALVSDPSDKDNQFTAGMLDNPFGGYSSLNVFNPFADVVAGPFAGFLQGEPTRPLRTFGPLVKLAFAGLAGTEFGTLGPVSRPYGSTPVNEFGEARPRTPLLKRPTEFLGYTLQQFPIAQRIQEVIPGGAEIGPVTIPRVIPGTRIALGPAIKYNTGEARLSTLTGQRIEKPGGLPAALARLISFPLTPSQSEEQIMSKQLSAIQQKKTLDRARQIYQNTPAP